ncbi:MAG: diaminopimelate decarboxylase [Candidatus Margulisiibacteriota bacterium]|jgi:diaminopimelate decarboxylase
MINTEMPVNMPLTSSISSKRHLTIADCDAIDLAKEFGTPLWVLDEETIRENCRKYKKEFQKHHTDAEVVYASKALSNTAVLQIVTSEGLGIDVVSGGELYTAKMAKVAPEKIYFHGNNKSASELEEALDYGVGRIVVDNLQEIEKLTRIATEKNKQVNILLRVNPGIEAHTHEFIQTGKVDSKFGFSKEVLADIVQKVQGIPCLQFCGLHVHIGSQIQETKAFLLTIEEILDTWSLVRRKTKAELKELNLGGGIGIEYLPTELSPQIEHFARDITKTLEYKIKELKIPKPKLIIEPGRSIIGKAGITLYTVGTIKDIPEVRKYVCVDGGMADNPRPITYGAAYDAVIANKILEPKNDVVTIAGKFCESGDILIKNFHLQKAEEGDILAVFSTGAYNYSMSSNYNRFVKPAMILVNKGKAKVILKRENYEDLVRNDLPL